MTDHHTLQTLQQRLIEAEAKIAHLKHVLIRVPHASGDHTDLCRMKNAGMPPKQNDQCHCHVALIRLALTNG